MKVNNQDSIINHQFYPVKFPLLRNPFGDLTGASIINPKGFTLVEVIIFIIVAGIIASGIFIPFMTSLKGSMLPEKVAKATYLAQYKMEELTKNTYNDSSLGPISLTAYADVDPTDFPAYQWRWQISYVDENIQNEDFITDRGYKLILVRVDDPDGGEIELQTMVTERP